MTCINHVLLANVITLIAIGLILLGCFDGFRPG